MNTNPTACPYCGEHHNQAQDLSDGVWSVVCLYCGAMGPTTTSKAGAHALWTWRNGKPPPNNPTTAPRPNPAPLTEHPGAGVAA